MRKILRKMGASLITAGMLISMPVASISAIHAEETVQTPEERKELHKELASLITVDRSRSSRCDSFRIISSIGAKYDEANDKLRLTISALGIPMVERQKEKDYKDIYDEKYKDVDGDGPLSIVGECQDGTLLRYDDLTNFNFSGPVTLRIEYPCYTRQMFTKNMDNAAEAAKTIPNASKIKKIKDKEYKVTDTGGYAIVKYTGDENVEDIYLKNRKNRVSVSYHPDSDYKNGIIKLRTTENMTPSGYVADSNNRHSNDGFANVPNIEELCTTFSKHYTREYDNGKKVGFYNNVFVFGLNFEKDRNSSGTSAKPANKPEAKKISISSAKVSGIKNFSYTGKNVSQKVSVKAGGKNATFKLGYSNDRKSIGEKYMYIVGTGKYTGKIKKTFYIIPANPKISISKKKGKYYVKASNVIGGAHAEVMYRAKKKGGKYSAKWSKVKGGLTKSKNIQSFQIAVRAVKENLKSKWKYKEIK